MPGFGHTLRRERERRGLTLADVARDINVGSHLVEALENDDLGALPGGPFNKGIVRAYARHLSMDPDDAIRRYRREEKARGLETPDADRQPRPRRVELRHDGERATLVIDWHLARSLAAAAVVVMAAVALTAYLVTRGSGASAAAAGEPRESLPEASLPAPAPGDLPASTSPDTSTEAPGGAAASASDSARQTAGGPAVEPPEARDASTAAPEPAALATPARAGDTGEPRSADARTGSATDAAETVTRPAAAPPGVPRIVDARIGRGLEDHRLVETTERFRVGERAWFWTRAVDGAGSTIEHVWLREGREVARQRLDVAGPDWRNASYKTLWPGSAGRWTVEARAADGHVLARRTFDCLPRDPDGGGR